MSNELFHFERGSVCLPHDVSALIQEWDQLRGKMIRSMPEAFSRDEWAYLITFLEEDHLWSVFEDAFGTRQDDSEFTHSALYYPRGTVSVWLPNNVSLLGPLVMILLSLSGNKLRLKAGSRSEDLCGALLDFVEAAGPGEHLARFIAEDIERGVFDQHDPRNVAMAAESEVRIVFGGDEAAAGIDQLPHPTHSLAFPFTDKKSQAWIEPEAVTDEVLDALIKVFLVYGQAGCTSPSRVVLLDADEDAMQSFKSRLIDRWPQVVKVSTEPHVASANVMARQWAAGVGWQAELAPNAAAVVGCGNAPQIDAPLFLPVSAISTKAALESLPENIQTIGYAFSAKPPACLLGGLAQRNVKRLVPIAQMHHFSGVWDGYAFWEQLFERMEVQT